MQQLRDEPFPVVILESPYRCLKTLAEWNTLMPEREMFLGRELTKLHEECLWGTVGDIYRRLTERASGPTARTLKGEIVIVLAPEVKWRDTGSRPTPGSTGALRPGE